MAANSVLSFEEDVDLPMLETDDDESSVIEYEDDDDYSDDETESSSSETEGNAHDWDSDENPYRRQLRDIEEQFGGGPEKIKERFTGLQKSVQEKEEARRAEEARRIQLEDAYFQSSIQHLEPQQQQQAWMTLQSERVRQAQTQQVQAREQQMSSYEQMLDGMARSILVNELSTSYGVPKEKLNRFNDPETMVAFAEEYKELRKQSRRNSRKTSKADQFETGGSVARPRKPNTYNGDLDSAASDFAMLTPK